ncbi:50S ribosomal protein L6 [Candidatus Woesearchaeota archaeon]|nr:50S ribosomal protein L6 [Candidatus Woesearchaeota archaeon]
MIPANRLTNEVEIPQGVDVTLGKEVIVKGAKGTVKKELSYPNIALKKEGNKIVLKPLRFTKEQKRMINTFTAHLNNMIRGVQHGYEYQLKVCFSHFPITVAVEKDQLVIKNFLGEKVPRKAHILPGAKVEVKGEMVIVTGPDREITGQTAANIEHATRITTLDRRVFQDGLWIVEKPGRVA